jgi:uncharacterized protein (TIGR00369 family)
MEDVAHQLNQADDGHFATFAGIEIDSALPDRLTAHIDIQRHHTQPLGIVHGGLYSTIVETLASIGGFLTATKAGKSVAGVENHTSFVRSTGAGTRVTAVAAPVHLGRTTQLWGVEIRDPQERLLARGTVRLAVLDLRSDGVPDQGPEGAATA